MTPDREFRRRLNAARAHFGTATTQTSISFAHRHASIEAVREFLDSLDPSPRKQSRKRNAVTTGERK